MAAKATARLGLLLLPAALAAACGALGDIDGRGWRKSKADNGGGPGGGKPNGCMYRGEIGATGVAAELCAEGLAGSPAITCDAFDVADKDKLPGTCLDLYDAKCVTPAASYYLYKGASTKRVEGGFGRQKEAFAAYCASVGGRLEDGVPL